MSGNDDLLAALRTAGGQSAPAEVTHAKRGKAVKGDPDQILWKVTLRVRPDHGSAFSVDVQTPYPKLDGGPSLGSRIGVVYDPKNHSKIAVDPNAPVESWGQAQAETMNRVISQASGSGGAVFAGGQWVSGGPGAPAGASNAAGGASVAQQLAQLTALKDKGALTDVEFQAAKARLLGT
jgi:hypothetical protein